MPIRVTPVVPSTITVHLGLPDEEAENITVSFPDYVKNVASSEIYPTWEPAAIEANILAIVSFALNRVYTEFYPSRGYDFDITSTTAYDQKFIRGRNIFENISRAVDETFNDYIRRTDFVEPLAAKFCNGTTSTCDDDLDATTAGLFGMLKHEIRRAVGRDNFLFIGNTEAV